MALVLPGHIAPDFSTFEPGYFSDQGQGIVTAITRAGVYLRGQRNTGSALVNIF